MLISGAVDHGMSLNRARRASASRVGYLLFAARPRKSLGRPISLDRGTLRDISKE